MDVEQSAPNCNDEYDTENAGARHGRVLNLFAPPYNGLPTKLLNFMIKMKS